MNQEVDARDNAMHTESRNLRVVMWNTFRIRDVKLQLTNTFVITTGECCHGVKHKASYTDQYAARTLHASESSL